MPQHYIEFRVYVKQDANAEEVSIVASEMHDHITDYVSDEYAPKVFTQDVTYTIVKEEN